jgi:hypothetical protein
MKTTGQSHIYTEMKSKLSSFNNSKIKRTRWFKHVVITPAVSAVLRQQRGCSDGEGCRDTAPLLRLALLILAPRQLGRGRMNWAREVPSVVVSKGM